MTGQQELVDGGALLDDALLETTVLEIVELLAGQSVTVGAQDVIVMVLVTCVVIVVARSAFRTS